MNILNVSISNNLTMETKSKTSILSTLIIPISVCVYYSKLHNALTILIECTILPSKVIMFYVVQTTYWIPE